MITALGLVVLLGTSAEGSMIVDNWTLDLDGVSGTSTSTFEGIDQIGFSNGRVRVIVSKGAGNVSPQIEPGDTAEVFWISRAVSLDNVRGPYDVGGPVYTPLLNAPDDTPGAWEITFRYYTHAEFVPGGVGGTLFWEHTDGPDSFFEMRIDEYGAGVGDVKANITTGLGYTDGDLVLRMRDTHTGWPNVINLPTADGSDDARFLYNMDGFPPGVGGFDPVGKTGVFFEFDGADDGVAEGADLVARAQSNTVNLMDINTDSNFDLSRYNVGDWTPPTSWSAADGPFPAGGGPNGDWPGPPPSPNLPLDFVGSIDGSVELSEEIVPEPDSASMLIAALLGCGLAVSIRRPRCKTKRHKVKHP